jgi:two-component system response regulator TctD
MRALVIEDNTDIAECIVQSLSDMDITSDWFNEGKYVASAFAVATYDILILDLNLPDGDGFKVLKDFRESGGKTPVLIISARISVDDRVSGLDLGADDYLVKPFALNEFEARVRALLRREFSSRSSCIQFGELTLDQTTRVFSLAEFPLELSGRERSVLEILIQKHGTTVGKETIAAHIFNFDDEADISAIEIYVHRLRKKLAGSSVSIVTHRGVGYALKIDAPV